MRLCASAPRAHLQHELGSSPIGCPVSCPFVLLLLSGLQGGGPLAALSFSKIMNWLDLKWACSFTCPVSQPSLGLDNQGCRTSLSHYQMVGTQGQGLHILQSLRESAEPWVGCG